MMVFNEAEILGADSGYISKRVRLVVIVIIER